MNPNGSMRPAPGQARRGTGGTANPVNAIMQTDWMRARILLVARAGSDVVTDMPPRRLREHLPRTPFGVHDVLGNVWEWTQDCWVDSYGGASGDGRSRQIAGCENRVIRGGSWINGPTFLRAARRDRIPSDRRFNVIGFRIGRTLDAVR